MYVPKHGEFGLDYFSQQSMLLQRPTTNTVAEDILDLPTVDRE
jgi:hypothetical protein